MPRPVPIAPKPGQESVWDYPRPPRVERVDAVLALRVVELTAPRRLLVADLAHQFGAAQFDALTSLAGDKGATVTLTREFANGWEVGAYATKTNLSAEEYGEGSFDKGIEIKIPLAWATGMPSKRTVGGSLSSLNRDGGQRVRVDGRLYDTIRDSHSTKMYDGWGKFWR